LKKCEFLNTTWIDERDTSFTIKIHQVSGIGGAVYFLLNADAIETGTM